MSRTSTAVALACLAALAPAISAAQVELGVGAGLAVLSGDYWSGTLRPPSASPGVITDRAFPVSAHVVLGVWGNGQVGLEVDYVSVDSDDLNEAVTVVDVALLARYLVPVGEAFLFVGGKVGYSRQSTSTELPPFPRPVDWVSHGSVIGPTLGFRIPIGAVELDLSVDGLRDTRGDWSADDGELTVGAYGKGLRIVPRIDLSMNVGGT